ncbi:MAG: hypothetical protein KF734_18285 [Saprospiraceae bacterium]|nr:hypothetical protein [Saprospiraceae bacterium]
MKTISLTLLAPMLLLVACTQPPTKQSSVLPPIPEVLSQSSPSTTLPFGRMNGLTFVAPPEPFPVNPMPAVRAVGANWIAIVPYAFLRPGTADVIFNEHSGQWWGERPEGARESIRLAHEADIRVMLKPQVWIPRAWTGTLAFQSDEEWEQWEKTYERYILRFAALADSTGVDMFCIGTEFNAAIQQRPQYWHQLIQKIKKTYKGKLTYSANWDDWDKVPFWAELDCIGLGGYFPLVAATTPTVQELKAAWEPIKERLRTYSKQQNRPILFTEFGYLSVDSSGWRNWELERDIKRRNINEQAQANCYEALFSTFQHEHWWAGGFLWKWFPNMRGHEGYSERDYTPQGKLGENTLRKWYRGE